MGTPDFAVPVLEALTKEHNIAAVYTRAPKESAAARRSTKRRYIFWQKRKA